MRASLKVVATGTVLLVAVVAYWNFKVSRKTDELAVIAQPFLTACNSNSGCILSPPGWEQVRDAYRLEDGGDWIKSSDTASFQGQMEYVANSNSFELRWHIGTDVYLVARGSTGSKLVITRVVS